MEERLNSCAFTNVGYSFEGWSTTPGGAVEYLNQDFVFPTQNMSLYASWGIRDYDGNSYTEEAIGSQVWMVENLRTTRFNDGTAIPLVTSDSAWGGAVSPAYSWYGNVLPVPLVRCTISTRSPHHIRYVQVAGMFQHLLIGPL